MGFDQDEEFDYLKEIEEIEAQERELEARRLERKAQLEKKRAQSAESQASQKTMSKKEMKEKKKEAEWLGEEWDDEDIVVVSNDTPVKKKSKKGLIFILILILLLLIGGGCAYAYKLQMDQKKVEAFQEKVAAFKSEKLDNVSYGSYDSFFEEWMTKCDQAIEEKNLLAIDELEAQWETLENTYTEVSNGKTSLDAFVSKINETLSAYKISDTYKESYEQLVKNIQDAQQKCEYTKLQDLQKNADELVVNLKSDNMKMVQEKKNKVAEIKLDSNYLSDEQTKSMDEYSNKVESYLSESNYVSAITELDAWESEKTAINKTITKKKEEEAAKAAAEAKRRAEEQAKLQASTNTSSGSSSSNSSSSGNSSSSNSSTSNNTGKTGGYVIPDSNSRYLTEADLKNLSAYQLMIARNEIYARRGRKFNDASLQSYFNSKSWYKGTIEPSAFSTSVFNAYEEKNIITIVEYENR